MKTIAKGAVGGEVALDAPCYVCMKPSYEKCPYEGKENDKSN